MKTPEESKIADFVHHSEKPHGVAVKSVLIPTVILLAILHAAIIVSIISININSGTLSSIMQDYSGYISDATSLLAGSSLLSETAGSYVFMPYDEAGAPNVGPLVAYVGELQNPRRGHDVMARFAEYPIDEEARLLLNTAAASADTMNEAQLHAVELVRSVYPLPPVPALEGLPRYELSDAEMALTNDEKLSTAIQLLFGSTYSSHKAAVSQNVNACVALLQKEMQEESGVASGKIAVGRRVLWAMTLTIIAVLITVFVIFNTLLVSPLTRFARGIDSDEALEDRHGMLEVRILANSYNALRQRRILTERFLRSAASTDALTGMPNRLSFNHYLIDHADTDTSIAIVLFDVNNLKVTNDTYGHLAGDKLICDSAACISSCFDPGRSGCCFRIGGDEFAVCLTDESEDALDGMIEHFREEQAARGISIAYGCAYSAAADAVLFDELFDRADRSMYEMKENMHCARA